MFHVGQKVVCVDDSLPPHGHWTTSAPVQKGAIYHIRGYEEYCLLRGVLLEEIVSEICYGEFGECEYFFSAERFRPVKTTDITIFTDILKTVETPPREKVGG